MYKPSKICRILTYNNYFLSTFLCLEVESDVNNYLQYKPIELSIIRPSPRLKFVV
jgi:hypothetical protein